MCKNYFLLGVGLPTADVAFSRIDHVRNQLGIEKVLRNATRGSKAKYDVNAVMRLLVTERIINPGSRKSAWEHKDRHFFRCDFSLDDTHRALDCTCACKERIVSSINRFVDKANLRDTTCVFYDVTSYCFEVDEPLGLKQKGMSKEHRPNPIVQMGLLQDSKGMPIGYKLFPGNTNDALTMIDVLNDMKRDYGCRRVIVVGDKGNNCSTNIAALVGRGNGFICSQSIRGTKSNTELRNWVISDEGYRIEGSDEQGPTYKIKSRQDFKSVTVINADGKEEKVDIEVKVVAFWSRKYERRAKKERRASIEKAHKYIANPGSYTAAANYGAAKYVKGIKFDNNTGELVECAETLSFDEERLAQEEACDGFYCIATSETEMGDTGIIEAYRGLWRIEESFKVTKSDLETRPVYVSLGKR